NHGGGEQKLFLEFRSHRFLQFRPNSAGPAASLPDGNCRLPHGKPGRHPAGTLARYSTGRVELYALGILVLYFSPIPRTTPTNCWQPNTPPSAATRGRCAGSSTRIATRFTRSVTASWVTNRPRWRPRKPLPAWPAATRPPCQQLIFNSGSGAG